MYTIKHIDYFSFHSSQLKSPIPGLPDIIKNEVVTAVFKDPKYDESFTFLAKRLPNAVDPPQVIQSENNKNGPIIGTDLIIYVFLYPHTFRREKRVVR